MTKTRRSQSPIPWLFTTTGRDAGEVLRIVHICYPCYNFECKLWCSKISRNKKEIFHRLQIERKKMPRSALLTRVSSEHLPRHGNRKLQLYVLLLLIQ